MDGRDTRQVVHKPTGWWNTNDKEFPRPVMSEPIKVSTSTSWHSFEITQWFHVRWGIISDITDGLKSRPLRLSQKQVGVSSIPKLRLLQMFTAKKDQTPHVACSWDDMHVTPPIIGGNINELISTHWTWEHVKHTESAISSKRIDNKQDN